MELIQLKYFSCIFLVISVSSEEQIKFLTPLAAWRNAALGRKGIPEDSIATKDNTTSTECFWNTTAFLISKEHRTTYRLFSSILTPDCASIAVTNFQHKKAYRSCLQDISIMPKSLSIICPLNQPDHITHPNKAPVSTLPP